MKLNNIEQVFQDNSLLVTGSNGERCSPTEVDLVLKKNTCWKNFKSRCSAFDQQRCTLGICQRQWPTPGR